MGNKLFKRAGKPNYFVRYTDPLTGRRREVSLRTSDFNAANLRAAEMLRDAMLVREGYVPPHVARARGASHGPIQRHLDAYIETLRVHSRSARSVGYSQRRLDWVVKQAGVRSLGDLTLDAVVRALGALKAERLSAATRNRHMEDARAFLNWCVKTQRLASNPLAGMHRADEQRDRRYVRRPLTSDEVTRLLAVADRRGWGLFYRLALYAGLRRSEVQRLRWKDIDLDGGVITVSDGKAKRVDEIPIHAELRPWLEREGRQMPSAPVSKVPVNKRRQDDYALAKIEVEDARGRKADLHSLRMTLHHMLIEAGVSPQVCQKVMRHADYKTTLSAYTDLGLEQMRGAMDAVGRKARKGKEADA